MLNTLHQQNPKHAVEGGKVASPELGIKSSSPTSPSSCCSWDAVASPVNNCGSCQTPTLNRPGWVSCSSLANFCFQTPSPRITAKALLTTMPKVLKVACSLTATWSCNIVKHLLLLWADKPSRDAGSSYGLGEAFSRGQPPSQSRILCFCQFKLPHSIFYVVLCSMQLCKFINHTLISTWFHKFSNSEKGGF